MNYSGDMSDEYADFYIEIDMMYEQIKCDAKTGIWTTKNGERIPVTKMTDSHLKNTINFLKRTDELDIYYPWICVMEEELNNRSIF